jgi:hypothetical protein
MTLIFQTKAIKSNSINKLLRKPNTDNVDELVTQYLYCCTINRKRDALRRLEKVYVYLS